MDIYNPKKELGKTSQVNDQYWKESYFIQSTLEEALEQDADTEIKRIINNPHLYRATS
jgi:hypothetical protein